MLAGCASRGRAIECRLERLVHQGGRARAQSLDRQLATPVLVGHSREMVEIELQAVEHDRVGVAQLEQRLGPAGDDAFLAGVQIDAPRGPDRARSTDLGKALVDHPQEPHQLEPGVAAAHHRSRSGMILLTDDCEPILPYCHDGSDNADLEIGVLQRVALFNMCFEEGGVAWLRDLPGASPEPCLAMVGSGSSLGGSIHRQQQRPGSRLRCSTQSGGRLVPYYGKDLEGVHLPFNFSLLETRWHAREIAQLLGYASRACARVHVREPCSRTRAYFGEMGGRERPFMGSYRVPSASGSCRCAAFVVRSSRISAFSIISCIANWFSASRWARLASLGPYCGSISLAACTPLAVKASNVLMCRSSCFRDSSGNTLALYSRQRCHRARWALAMRLRPSIVRGPVDFPPWLGHRPPLPEPLRRHGWPGLVLAPHVIRMSSMVSRDPYRNHTVFPPPSRECTYSAC